MSLTINGTSPDNIVYNGTQVYKVIYNGVEVWKKSFPFTLNLTLEYFSYSALQYQGCLTTYDEYLGVRISSISATGSTSSFQSIKLASFKIQGLSPSEHVSGWGFLDSPDIEILNKSQYVNGDDHKNGDKTYDWIFFSQADDISTIGPLDVSIELHLVGTLVDGTEIPVTINYQYSYVSSYVPGSSFPTYNKTLTFNRSVYPE